MTRDEYLLNMVQEEAAEVAQRASKALRFGLQECQPGQDLDNRTRLEQELGDLLGVLDMLGLRPCQERRQAKPARVQLYMEYSRRLGRVHD